jgi:hypothetical protein
VVVVNSIDIFIFFYSMSTISRGMRRMMWRNESGDATNLFGILHKQFANLLLLVPYEQTMCRIFYRIGLGEVLMASETRSIWFTTLSTHPRKLASDSCLSSQSNNGPTSTSYDRSYPEIIPLRFSPRKWSTLDKIAPTFTSGIAEEGGVLMLIQQRIGNQWNEIMDDPSIHSADEVDFAVPWNWMTLIVQ